MSKSNKRIAAIQNDESIKFFQDNPRAFANYTLRVNLLEGGSQENNLSQYELGVALNEENILEYKILLAQLLNKPFISAN